MGYSAVAEGGEGLISWMSLAAGKTGIESVGVGVASGEQGLVGNGGRGQSNLGRQELRPPRTSISIPPSRLRPRQRVLSPANGWSAL